MSLRALSITLANGIIGVGILAMPFCFQQCGAVLAAVLLLLSNLISRLTCHFLLKSGLIVRKMNMQFLALHVFGPTGKLAVEIGIIGYMMGTCIAYFVVVGDLGPQIIAKIFNVNQSDWLRTSIMMLVSFLCVLPLGLLRNIDSLTNVSAATIAFYICLIFKIVGEAGARLVTSDWWDKFELWKPQGVLQCLPIFAMALSCQTQIFEVLGSSPPMSLEKMNTATKYSINLCSGVYLMVGLFGYIAFCSQTISGNVLVSLSDTMPSDVIKLGFVMSLAVSFPLVIFPCRASIFSLLYRRAHSASAEVLSYAIPPNAFRTITVGIISISLFISVLIPNIELVLGLVGSTIGVVVCIVFPALCFCCLTFKNTNERVLAQIILVLGIFVVVLGTMANLEAAGDTYEHIDYRYLTQDKIDQIVDDFMRKRENELRVVHDVAEKPPNEKSVEQTKDSVPQPPVPVRPIAESIDTVKFNKADKFISDSKERIQNNVEKERINFEGAGDKEINILQKIDENIQKLRDIEKQNKVIPKEEASKVENDVKQEAPATEDKVVILKQQKLVEKIQQHRVEQKELIQEQKEILDEIIKTKLVLQNIKKTEDNPIPEDGDQAILNKVISKEKVVPNNSYIELIKEPIPIALNKNKEKLANEVRSREKRDLGEVAEICESKNNLHVKVNLEDSLNNQADVFQSRTLKEYKKVPER